LPRSLWRGRTAAAAFGHGDARGAWFLRVNLMRDLHALCKREMSDWNRWRALAPADGDRIAAETRRAGLDPPAIERARLA